MYGRHDVLQEVYDFDNRPFIKSLEDRGFYVAKESRANYNSTEVALPALMNFDYVASQAKIESNSVSYSTLMRESRATKIVKQHGYELTSYATGIETTELRNADNFLEPPENLSEFAALLINKTAARFVMNRIRSYNNHNHHYDFFDIHRNRILLAFQGIKDFTRGKVPQIVFAHILLPHDPFVLDTDITPLYPPMEYFISPEEIMPDSNIQLYIDGYRNQVQAFNLLALEAVDAILEKYPDTVILILGDHGPRLKSYVTMRNEDWTSHIDEEMGILNAFYLSGVDYAKVLYPSISPVKSFRIVFNEYFNETLPMLEDRSWFIELRNGNVHDVTNPPQLNPTTNPDSTAQTPTETKPDIQ